VFSFCLSRCVGLSVFLLAASQVVGETHVAHARPATATPKVSPVNFVDPMIGTGGRVHTYPGATVPFGMVQISPDTPERGWAGTSGYHYKENTIWGFSQTHLSGTGIGGLGDVLVMPTVGKVALEPGTPGNGYSSHFSHDREEASPGYYRVYLENPGVTAELTATTRCGHHRYTFPASDEAHIVIDLAHGIANRPLAATLKVENDTTLSGSRLVRDWGGQREVYFVMQFSKPFKSIGIESDGKMLDSEAREASGVKVKTFASYSTMAGEEIEVKIGISGTSVDGARKNLSGEIPGWGFDQTHAAARQSWDKALGAVEAEIPDPKIRTTFYTNLYQCFLGPVIFNDVDGAYRGLDRKNHYAPGFQNYTTFSLWDTFRAQAPLLTLLQPARVPDMMSSMLAHYRDFGRNSMPVWPLWGNETWCMIGYHSAPLVADAYLKGFRGFDAEGLYRALRDTAMQDRNGLDEYRKNGYIFSVSGRGMKQSVSRTLEYAYDDYCIGKLAEALGHKEDAQLFFKRAGNYRNLFDSTTGFMRGRQTDGSWRVPFNPKQLVWADYTEANAWHYNWTVMQDVPDLVDILGGDKAFAAKLDEMFNETSEVPNAQEDISGLVGQYAHGNEPDQHAPYFYNYVGMPSKTQARVRQLMTDLYSDQPDGQSGNNDVGQMSAWYVFSALGFYPVNPAGGDMVIGSPLIDKATIHFDVPHYGGKSFTVIAENNSRENVYIQSARLNGKNLRKSWLSHAELVGGGELHLKMGPKPNLKWGSARSDRPGSGMPSGFRHVALPKPYSKERVVFTLPIRVAGAEAAGDFKFDPNITEGAIGSANVKIDASATGAGPTSLYQGERYGPDFSYRYSVPAGDRYRVVLHFAEIFDEKIGERLQNVQINGKTVLENFDILAVAGGVNRAVVREFTDIGPDEKGNILIRVSVAPGSLDRNAKISGLEILRQ
jgi:predicted alpha-1,2-mannosidase